MSLVRQFEAKKHPAGQRASCYVTLSNEHRSNLHLSHINVKKIIAKGRGSFFMEHDALLVPICFSAPEDLQTCVSIINYSSLHSKAAKLMQLK